MVQAVVVNKQGKTLNKSTPCFGFMAYINQWREVYVNRDGVEVDEDDETEFDWDSVENVYKHVDGFEPNNLATLIWIPQPRWVTPEVEELVRLDFPEILKAFPQFYKDVTIKNLNGPTNWSPSANIWHEEERARVLFPLEGHNMQVTIIGAMMLRNITDYTACNRAYQMFRNNGYDVKHSFIFAQIFNGNDGFMGRISYWFSSTDDSSIFSDDTQVGDLRMVMDGELGNVWQGDWGSTETGYGRDGSLGAGYDDTSEETAPYFERTGDSSTLRDVLMRETGFSQDEPEGRFIESIIRQNTESYHSASEEEVLKCVSVISNILKGEQVQ